MKSKIREHDVNEQSLLHGLAGLGVSIKASQLYILVFKKAANSLAMMAKMLGISRPTLYKLIAELSTFGLVKQNNDGIQSEKIQIVSPSHLFRLWEEKHEEETHKQQQYIQHLPTLLELYEQGSNASIVKIVKGSDDFVKLFFQILDEEDKVTEFFGSAEDFIQFISWDIDRKWIKKRVKKQILLRTLIVPSQEGRLLQKLDKKQYRETRSLLGMRPFETAFQLFANKVIFWQPASPLALVIEDQFIVQMMRSIFYYCWER